MRKHGFRRDGKRVFFRFRRRLCVPGWRGRRCMPRSLVRFGWMGQHWRQNTAPTRSCMGGRACGVRQEFKRLKLFPGVNRYNASRCKRITAHALRGSETFAGEWGQSLEAKMQSYSFTGPQYFLMKPWHEKQFIISTLIGTLI